MTNASLQQVLGGRFRLDAQLGQGGMGSVFAATDLSIHRRVAIKLLRRELADDPVALERMREEASSLAALHHPNVVQLYDFHAGSPETTFILMELVDGESLSRRLHARGPLPVSVAVDYARQVLSALSAAHAKGIVHRDIKPANVLVASVPMQKDLIKVLDFGIAKLTEETLRRRPTTAGILLGTPSFMSPEQASGHPVDARSDIYAAGLLLYTMLAGQNPFSGSGDIASTLVRVQSVVPPLVSNVRGDVPHALAEVIAVAMSKNPAERFRTAHELVDAIDWSVAGDPSTRGSNTHSAPAVVPTNAPATLAATASASMPPSFTQPTGTFRGTSMPPQAPRGGISSGGIVAIVVLAGLLVVTIGALTFLLGRSSAPAAESPPLAADAAPSVALSASAAPSTTTIAIAPTAAGKTTARKPTSGGTTTATATPTTGASNNCECALKRDDIHVFKEQGGLALAKSIVPVDCQCDSKEGGTLCAHEIKTCSPKAPGSDPTPAGCTNDGTTVCKTMRMSSKQEGIACEGWARHNAQKMTGVAGSCRFPDSATSRSGKSGDPCTGFTVMMRQAPGILRCD